MNQKQNKDFKYLIQIPNFLSSEKCDELKKDIMESEQDVIGCVGDEQGKNAVMPEIRKTNEWYLCEQKDNELKLIEYQKGGFYGWHTDFNAGTCSVRKLVGIVQLTDPSEYEGGDVQFGIQDKDTKEWYTMNKLKGSLTLFPAFLCHNVVPVSKGKRYVIQELFIGDHFK